jgi:hypothetical protein
MTDEPIAPLALPMGPLPLPVQPLGYFREPDADGGDFARGCARAIGAFAIAAGCLMVMRFGIDRAFGRAFLPNGWDRAILLLGELSAFVLGPWFVFAGLGVVRLRARFSLLLAASIWTIMRVLVGFALIHYVAIRSQPQVTPLVWFYVFGVPKVLVQPAIMIVMLTRPSIVGVFVRPPARPAW